MSLAKRPWPWPSDVHWLSHRVDGLIQFNAWTVQHHEMLGGKCRMSGCLKRENFFEIDCHKR
jgi:hypothetical protein